jgi:hypothetical protein
LKVVGGPGVVVRGAFGQGQVAFKANLNGNMEVTGIVSFIEQFGGWILEVNLGTRS